MEIIDLVDSQIWAMSMLKGLDNDQENQASRDQFIGIKL